MSLISIISLAIALAGTYLSLNISEEASRIMAFIVAIIGLLLNLSIAPWFVQLFILLLILIYKRKDVLEMRSLNKK